MTVVGTIFQLVDPTRPYWRSTYIVRVTGLEKRRRNGLYVRLQHVDGGLEQRISAQVLRSYVRDGYLKEYP